MAREHPDDRIEIGYRDKMNMLARFLDEQFNGEAFMPRERGKSDRRKIGFVLLMFRFGDEPSRCNYISNGADRKEIAVLMREMAARFEGQPEVTGRA